MFDFLGAGKAITDSVTAIGNTVDKLFTSDDERLQAKIKLDEIELKVNELTARAQTAMQDLAKLDAKSSSLFNSGWRPSIGWTGSLGLFYGLVFYPIFDGVFIYFGIPLQQLNIADIVGLVMVLLGQSWIRSQDKRNGVAKD